MAEPAATQQPAQDVQYIKLPDGSYGKFAGNADDATIQAAISKDFPDAFKPQANATGKTPSGNPAEGDTRNGFQRWADNMTSPDTRREEWQSPLQTGVNRFAQHVAGSFLTPFAHPIQTGIGLAKSLGNAVNNSGGTPGGFASELARPMIDNFATSYADEGPAKAIPGLLGDVVGGAATAELGGAAAGGVARAARPLTTSIGGAMERGGLNLGNAALGARGPKPFQYGANPARGAFDEGILPSMSKHSAAMKTEAALPLAGEKISQAVTSSPNPIPLRNLSDSIESPINEARGVIRGPGGGNRSVEPLDALQNSMQAKAPDAVRPIYGPEAGTPYSAEEAAQAMTASEPSPLLDLRHPTATPSDVWKTVQNIDRNTRFNPDPEVEGVNEIRRSVRGGLRGNLEDAVPGLKPLSQRYSDLKGVETALDKTMHSGTTIGKMAAVPMFPIEGLVGRGLYNAGQALPQVGEFAGPAGSAGSIAASVTRKDKKER